MKRGTIKLGALAVVMGALFMPTQSTHAADDPIFVATVCADSTAATEMHKNPPPADIGKLSSYGAQIWGAVEKTCSGYIGQIPGSKDFVDGVYQTLRQGVNSKVSAKWLVVSGKCQNEDCL